MRRAPLVEHGAIQPIVVMWSLVQSLDGIETECPGLWVFVLEDVQALESGSDPIRNGIANVRILQALEIIGIGEITADDMNLGSLQPLE